MGYSPSVDEFTSTVFQTIAFSRRLGRCDIEVRGKRENVIVISPSSCARISTPTASITMGASASLNACIFGSPSGVARQRSTIRLHVLRTLRPMSVNEAGGLDSVAGSPDIEPFDVDEAVYGPRG